MSDLKTPYIVDIKRNSLDDGPGIRTVVFFKGCPLSCLWCQNPETKSPKQEIYFEKENCTQCFDCVDRCRYDAFDFSEDYPVNRENCIYCGECIEICETNALKFAGKRYTIPELMKIILKDKVFYQNSGGGVTFSGGEPTMHTKYLHQLLKELKNESIHICLETCGFYNNEKFKNLILPHIDLIYFDLKIFDRDSHNQYCKADNSVIFKNFEQLLEKHKEKILPRIPLIPDLTATKQNLSDWAKYLKDLGVDEIGLLPYNPLWTSKMVTLGKKEEYSRSEWLTKKEKRTIKKMFQDFEYRDF
ncbi:MAG: glycyl-radical enzyme activating protein [Promethearchaeia archaeon]